MWMLQKRTIELHATLRGLARSACQFWNLHGTVGGMHGAIGRNLDERLRRVGERFVSAVDERQFAMQPETLDLHNLQQAGVLVVHDIGTR